MKIKKLLASLTVASLLAGLGSTGMIYAQETEQENVLTVAFSSLSGNFSPFFAQQRNDLTAAQLTQEPLFVIDRSGGVILEGIDGQTVSYEGNDYTYYSPADCTVTENDDGSVDYEIRLRDDLTFSDEEPVTIDDVIFDLYVRCDPTYDGPSTLAKEPIKGLREYRSGMASLLFLMTAAGENNTNFSVWSEEEQKAFFADYNQAAIAFVQEIINYCKAFGYNAEGDTIAQCAASWGYQLPEDANEKTFWNAMVKAYNGDLDAMVAAESAGSSLEDLMANYDAYRKGIQIGTAAPSISGIQKIDDYTAVISAETMDATLIYQLADSVCPLHYYGDKSLYDYENNSFGFVKGDLSGVREKSRTPMGMGPYKYVSGENGTVLLESNSGYYKGEAKIKNLALSSMPGEDLAAAVADGRADLTVADFDEKLAQEIREYNGGELSGDALTSVLMDHAGYGYIGINADNVCVAGNPSSDESKNLRKAFAALFAVYREDAIAAYYGGNARTVDYPVSAVSWASPWLEEDGYEIAFSKDADGNAIYAEEMSREEQYAMAKEAALGYFKAAGFTVEDGKVTAPASGAKLSYEVQVPAEGIADHPCWQIMTSAQSALADIGITLNIRDVKNISDLWSGLRAGNVEMWCAAWTAAVDPDLSTVYYSALSKNGEGAGESSYLYKIQDLVLDEMIVMAREGDNRIYRKALYKACFDTIMDWACVVPVYQREDVILYRTSAIDPGSLPEDMTAFYSWDAQIQDLQM